MSSDRDSDELQGELANESGDEGGPATGPPDSLGPLLAAIADLWELDLEGREMALRFEP